MLTRYFSRIVWGAVAMGVLSTAGVQAQEDVWQAERAKLEKVIVRRVAEAVRKEITREKVAMHERMKWPVRQPKLSKKVVVEFVAEKVDQQVEKEFADSDLEHIRKEAAEKYRIFKLGEPVHFTLRRGGRAPNVEGKLRAVTQGYVKVSGRKVSRMDISEEVLANYDPMISKKYQDEYVEKRMRWLKVHKRKAKEDGLIKKLPLAFKASGYQPKTPKDSKSMDPEDWISRADELERRYKAMCIIHGKRIYAKVSKEVFTQSGYVFVKEAMPNGQWIPEAEADAFRAELKRATDASKQATEDPFGAGAGGPAEGGGTPAVPEEDVWE